MRGTSSLLLTPLVPGLQRTLGGPHYCYLLQYRLCMRMLSDDASRSSYQAPMNIFSDHAFLCPPLLGPSSVTARSNRPLACSCVLQSSLTWSSHSSYVCHGSRGPSSVAAPGSLTPRNILPYGWRGDRHYCEGLVGVSSARGRWRDVVSALAIVEHAKQDKHKQTCASHRFDLVPFGFSVSLLLWPSYSRAP